MECAAASYRRALVFAVDEPVDYSDSWMVQRRLHLERVTDGRPDTLLLLEHRPVYTLGRRTSPSHLLQSKEALLASGASVEMVNRGGSVTYHGPGQLVGYPILRLADVATGPKEYVRGLESVLIRTLAAWGIEGCRLDGHPGLFVASPQGLAKIACIGVRVDRGVTLHGFSLNVNIDLAPFSAIVPCGIAGIRTTSMAEVTDTPVRMRPVMRRVSEEFARMFRLEWTSPIIESPAAGGSLSSGAELLRTKQVLHA